MYCSKYRYLYLLSLTLIFYTGCSEESNGGKQNEKNTASAPNKEVIRSNENQDQELSKQVEQYLKEGKIQEAIALLEKEHKKFPEKFSLQFQLADLYLQSGDSTTAVRTIEESIKMGNRDPEAIAKIGYILADRNDQRCLDYAQLLIEDLKTGKSAYLGHFLKGIYFANLRKKKMAIESFDQCLIENYRFIDAYIEKAMLLFEDGQFEKSVKLLKQGVEIDKFQADLYYWLGRNNEKLNQTVEAIFYYEQTLVLAPDFENARIRMDSLNKILKK